MTPDDNEKVKAFILRYADLPLSDLRRTAATSDQSAEDRKAELGSAYSSRARLMAIIWEQQEVEP